MNLADLLQVVPGLYEDLEDAALARAKGEPGERRGSGDPRSSPAPGRVEVMEHRHELLRGLRWWVDAVAPNPADRPTIVGGNVTAMCRLLTKHLPAMAPEDRAELRANLDAWRVRAWRLMDPAPREAGDLGPVLPPQAAEVYVPKRTAAQMLGCSVDTVERRAGRVKGDVRVADLLRPLDLCRHDLWLRTCAECAGSRA